MFHDHLIVHRYNHRRQEFYKHNTKLVFFFFCLSSMFSTSKVSILRLLEYNVSGNRKQKFLFAPRKCHKNHFVIFSDEMSSDTCISVFTINNCQNEEQRINKKKETFSFVSFLICLFRPSHFFLLRANDEYVQTTTHLYVYMRLIQ